MGIAAELKTEVGKIFRDSWTEREGQKVPVPEDLKLGNDAVRLDGVVLYADLADSTQLVDNYKPLFAAEVYKAFLHCSARIIRDEGGDITAYDGDRIMAVFIGASKNSMAARTALKINWARNHVINPGLKAQYPSSTYSQTHVVGVDASTLWVARTGVRGDNDLVWIGRAANHAAKMAALPSRYSSYISEEVFNSLNKDSKYSGQGVLMWDEVRWEEMGRTIYRSTYEWEP